MNVLMYGWEFPPHINGGLGIACYGIVQALLRQNVHVSLVLPHMDLDETTAAEHEFAAVLKHPNLTIYGLNSPIKPYCNDQKYNEALQMCGTEKNKYALDLMSEVRRYARLAGHLAKWIPHDVIHAHDWLTILAGIEAKKISHKPLFFHVHALETDRSGPFPHSGIVAIEKEGLDNADHVFSVSQYTRQILIDQYHVNADKIEVIYNGISEAYAQRLTRPAPKQSKMVLFLGRMTHQKGPFYFIDMARKILSVRQDIQFVMVGEGDLLNQVIEYAAQHRLGPYIHFVGFLDRTLVRKIFEMSQVYVMPSVSEPFGISCLEALTLNVPAVISKQSGAAEVLHHVFKVDFWDTVTMAEKIMALVDYPILGVELLKYSKDDVQALSWDNSVRIMMKAYQNLMRS